MKGLYVRLLGCLVFVLAILLLYPNAVRAQTTYRIHGFIFVGYLGEDPAYAGEITLYDEDTTQIDWTCIIFKKDAGYEFFVESGTYYLKVDMAVHGASGPGSKWQSDYIEVVVTTKDVFIHLTADTNIGICPGPLWPCTDCPCPYCE